MYFLTKMDIIRQVGIVIKMFIGIIIIFGMWKAGMEVMASFVSARV